MAEQDEPGKRFEIDWDDVKMWGSLVLIVAGMIWAWPHAKTAFYEYRCSWRLRDYLRQVVPPSRGAEVDKCTLTDAIGYCFVTAIGDDGARRTEPIPVVATRPAAIDITKLFDDLSRKDGKQEEAQPIVKAIIGAIAGGNRAGFTRRELDAEKKAPKLIE